MNDVKQASILANSEQLLKRIHSREGTRTANLKSVIRRSILTGSGIVLVPLEANRCMETPLRQIRLQKCEPLQDVFVER